MRRGLALFFVAACGGSGTTGDPIGPPEETCPGTELKLGTGLREYLPVADGDTVSLYRGPQGGYMVYLSVHALGLDPADNMLCYTERFADSGTVFGEGCWRVRLTNDMGGGWWERVGVWGEVEADYWTRPLAIRGKNVRVDVKLTDSKGCTVAAGWDVRIADEPGM
jgi:hypothetical protein